jgi:acetyltransferase-like isoleucine patch superfamily enzyme
VKRAWYLLSQAIRLVYTKLWLGVSALILRLGYPHHFGFLKRFVIRRCVQRVGVGAIISPGFFVFRGFNTSIADRCSIGYRFQIFDFEPVSIGPDLLASHNVTLIAGTHLHDARRTYVPGPINIGRNVWIGANVLFVGPCSIGDNCIIGANSFVNDDFPAGSVIGGSPARLIRRVDASS